MPPTDQGFGATGNERIVVHACTVDGQPAFATQSVVDGKEDNANGMQDANDEHCQTHVEEIEIP